MAARAHPLRVDVLAFDGCFGAVLFGIADMLTVANAVAHSVRPDGVLPFRTRVVSVDGRTVTLADGTVIRPQPADTRADLVVVPGFRLVDPADLDRHLAAVDREVAHLAAFRRRSTGLASLCVGASLLAEARLLDGHVVTTSWMFAPELARRYPEVDVQASEVVVRDGRVSTAAAFTAYQELALLLIDEHAGPHVARAVSRVTLVGRIRSSQDPYVDRDLAPVRHAGLADDVRRWLRAHLAERYDLARLAGEHHVSTRTLLRRFAADTGESPLEFLQSARVDTAKRLLETSDLTITEITRHVGYTDTATFRELFRDRTGTTPSEYRRNFTTAGVARTPR